LNGWFSYLVTGLLVLAFATAGKAQDNTAAFFDRITTADGLSYDKVRSIIQDRKGFIWIGTLNGLNRYDGHRFKTWFQLRNDSSSLPDNRIIKIYEDAKANLWLCTFAGISRYDPVTEKFDNYFFRSADGSSKTITCYDIKEMNGVYWVATVHGLCRLNLNDRSIESFPGLPADDLINTEICYNLLPSTSGFLWVATFRGMIKVDPEKLRYQHIRITDGILSHEKADNQVSWLAEDSDRHFWIGTWSGGLKKFDAATNRFVTFMLTKSPGYTSIYNIARNILAGKDKRYLWIASAGEGLFRFDKQSGRFESFLSKDIHEKFGVPAGGAFCLWEDNRGRIWVGGEFGIYLMDPAKQFVQRKQIAATKDEICQREISAIFHDPADQTGNTYWFSTYGCGIFKTDSNFSRTIPLNAFFPSIPHKPMAALDFMRDGKNNLWLACGSAGVYRFNEKDRQIKRLDNLPFTISYRKILTDGSGTIWVRSSAGLFYFDPASDQLKLSDHPVLSKVNVIDIEADHSGNLWALRNCTDDGGPLIYKIDQKTKTVTAFAGAFSKQFTCLDQKTLNDFAIDENNVLWIASSAGLIMAPNSGTELQTEFFPRPNERQGLFINRVKTRGNKYLWLSSSHGILLFNKTSGTIEKNLTPADGLIDFDVIELFQDKKGRLFNKGRDGDFNIISAHAFTSAPPPPVVLTGVRIFNQGYLVPGKAITDLKEIKIDYRQNNLQFEFAALDYTNPSKQQFAYRLEGFSRDWIYTDHAFAVYNNLKGGKYTFHVRASNGDGVWNNEGISVQLTVIPPFWTRSWFIFLLFTAGALTLFLFVRRHIRNIRKEARLKQMRAEAEMTALRAQMNPHFIFNCMNTIDAYILKNNQEEASDILQKFSRLIRQVLENSGNDTIFIFDEIETLRLYIELEECILENRFTHSLRIDPAISDKPYRIPAMIIQPFVENAILHGLRHKSGKDGHLQLQLRLEGSRVICEVVDNGIGRKAAALINSQRTKPRQSLGMEMTQKRISTFNTLHHEKIEVKITDIDSGSETGTRVLINFPVTGI
jgi:ligand-binding sensor domain-containing protein